MAHKENIIHRDLKPTNILLFKENELKLCDLGISTVCATDDGGTEDKDPIPIYNSKTDVFSLGLILFELFVWKPIPELNLIFNNYRAGN
ncbi:hypothetical protein PMAYCL1PPCAC_09402 [Pristionchus mayeri]|uniref:Protein kinase domain-containing protein n=1 Tax=Pristionchus mayeri TaxID=1317129 RepID=A0AAN4ZJF3_9BILA|nr:hypothetical protein PMAYCL1PPCAC_09402 [Pristionchus mayeri]